MRLQQEVIDGEDQARIDDPRKSSGVISMKIVAGTAPNDWVQWATKEYVHLGVSALLQKRTLLYGLARSESILCAHTGRAPGPSGTPTRTCDAVGRLLSGVRYHGEWR